MVKVVRAVNAVKANSRRGAQRAPYHSLEATHLMEEGHRPRLDAPFRLRYPFPRLKGTSTP